MSLLSNLGYGNKVNNNHQQDYIGNKTSPFLNYANNNKQEIDELSHDTNYNTTVPLMSANGIKQKQKKKCLIPNSSLTMNQSFGITPVKFNMNYPTTNTNDEFKISTNETMNLNLTSIENETKGNDIGFPLQTQLSPITNRNKSKIPNQSLLSANRFNNNDEMSMNDNRSNNQTSSNLNTSYIERKNQRSKIIHSPCEVAIVGFPPSEKMYILQKFLNYGRIVKHEVRNNVLYVRYSNECESSRALVESGKWINHHHLKYMIAVLYKENTEKEKNYFDNEANENSSFFNNPSFDNRNGINNGSMLQNGSMNNVSSFGTMQTGRFMKLKNWDFNDQSVITKDDTLWTKASNLLFSGW